MSDHKIICGDVIPVLKSLPDEHVDMLMTSVPYWGLRDYGEDTATIWGGDKSCEHDFSFSEKEHDNLRYRGSASIVSNEQNEEIHKGKKKQRWVVLLQMWCMARAIRLGTDAGTLHRTSSHGICRS